MSVKFVSAKKYLNVSDEEFDNLFFCLKGRQEVVVECDDKLKEKLRGLPQEYMMTPSFKTVVAYLLENNIPFTEDYKNTTRI